MKKFNKRLGRSRSGVSDIIGNLLILAITVTLFSSIMFYVANMPEPAEATFTDLEPSLSNIQDDSTIWVNVTHKGGQTLKGWSTGIYIFVNGTLTPALSVGDGGVGEDWKTGEVWRFKVNFSNEITGLSIMIVDKDTNSIVWQTDLLGGVTNIQLPPIIGTRYTSPSPGLENRSMVLYVQVMDPNDDNITGVYADMTALGLGLKTLTKVSQNLYTVDITDKAKYIWDNRKIIISATDDTGLSSSTLMTIRVNPASSGSNGGGGGGDGEFPNFDISGLQGFALFEWNDWNLYNMAATNRNIFFKDTENAVVVMISKTVVNTIGKNELLVMNPNTKVVVPEVSSTGTPPNNFKYYGFIAGFYIYNSTIDTSTLGGNYSISATLTDSKTRPDTFTFNTWMNVLTGTSDSDYPTFKTYKGSFSLENEWTRFSVSDQSRNKILVEVQTEDAYAYQVGSGNVEIRDFVWATQVKRSPAATLPVNSSLNNWNGPVSNVWQISAGNGIYRFVINLANCTTGAEWLPMNNAYILRFDVFKTTGETFLLTKVIYIDAPTTKYDIVAGLENPGGAAWNTQSSLFYYFNDNSWLPPTILETTADRKESNPVVVQLEAGDINGDGSGDFAAVMAYGVQTGGPFKPTSINPVIYQSTSGSSFFKTLLPALSSAVIADVHGLALGNVDEDDNLDMVIAHGNTVYLYKNDGAWTRTPLAKPTGGYIGDILGVRIVDMDPPSATSNDPLRSYDIVVVTANRIYVHQNIDRAGNFYASNIISLQASSGVVDVFDYANGEETIEGTITAGDYTVTRTQIENQYLYEELSEATLYNTVKTYPTNTGTGHNATDPLSDMWELNDGFLYTIPVNRTMNITIWDNTYLDLPQGDIEVILVFNYTATDYLDSDNELEFYNITTGSWQPLETISNGEHYQEIPLNFITDANQLAALKVRFVNDANGILNIDAMYINVTYQTGDSLTHIWDFQITPGSTYSFNLFASTSGLAEGDTFLFQYSQNMINWTNITTISNTGALDSITPIALPNTISGTTLYVRVIDTIQNNPYPINDWVRVGYMYIKGLADLPDIGQSIKAFDIADMDGDGSNDIVVQSISSTNREQVWILYNGDYYSGTPATLKSGIFNNNRLIYTSASTGTGFNSIEAGRFFGNWNDSYLDIVLRKANTFSGIDQTSKDVFSSSPSNTLISLSFLSSGLSSGKTVSTISAQDIDGNNRCDLVIGYTDGTVIYFANYGGTTTTIGKWAGYSWQTYLIDQLGDRVIDIAAGQVLV
ncbi:MAG: type IV pilin N-terminal domain-containing protein [Methanomassiliicoccales archaeon]